MTERVAISHPRSRPFRRLIARAARLPIWVRRVPDCETESAQFQGEPGAAHSEQAKLVRLHAAEYVVVDFHPGEAP